MNEVVKIRKDDRKVLTQLKTKNADAYNRFCTGIHLGFLEKQLLEDEKRLVTERAKTSDKLNNIMILQL